MRSKILLLALALTLTATSCGGSSDPVSLTSAGAQALNSSHHREALSKFEAALEQMDEGHTHYLKAKLGAIEARIYVDADAAKAEFLALALALPDRIGAKDYRAIGGRMTDAKKYSQAIDILDAGIKAFPEDDKMKPYMDAVTKAAQADGDSGALDKLAGLGYL